MKIPANSSSRSASDFQQPNCAFSGLAALAILCSGPALAQTSPALATPGLTADFAYTRASGSGGFASNALSTNVEFAALPLTIGFDGTQSLTDGVETSTQFGANAKWRVSPLVSVTARLATANDELVNVNTRGFSIAWNLHRLWQGKHSTRLELGRDTSDYSLQAGTSTLSVRIPQQQRTTVELLQGLSPNLDVYASAEWYTYTRDPVDLARALLNRKARRVNLASKLGNLTDQTVTLGASWSIGSDWNLDLFTSRSNTVVDQDQFQWGTTLSYAFHPKASASFGYTASRSNALVSNTGQQLSPQQDDTTIELGIKWLY